MPNKGKIEAKKKTSSGKKTKKISFQKYLDVFSSTTTEWLGSNSSLILHTIFFAISFGLVYVGVSMDRVLLVVTTVVSLEAIYMNIFIQMAVNKNTKSLKIVEKDIDEIQEDVEEIQEDVEEIGKDVDSIEKDIDEIQEDVDELQEDEDEDETTQKQLTDLSEQLQAIITHLRHVSGEQGKTAKNQQTKK